MRPKQKGWKEGVLSKSIKSMGGTLLLEGQVVRYKRYKTLPDRSHGGWKLTDHEWHYTDTDNQNLIRMTELIIEGVPYLKEPYSKDKK
jgi:hypothetical protein